MRKEWIDEGKPGYIKREGAEQETGDSHTGTDETRMGAGQQAPTGRDDSLFIPDSHSTRDNHDDHDQLPEDDELDTPLAEQDVSPPSRPQPPASKTAVDGDSEGEDDLDALLAEQETRRPPPPEPATSKALAVDEDDDDMDDLDALLAEQEARSKPDLVQLQSKPSTPATAPTAQSATLDDSGDIVEDDDLDALLAEEEAHAVLHTSVATRLATPPPASQEAENMERNIDLDADGADMFDSSPVRTNTAFATRMTDGGDDPPATLPGQSAETFEGEEDDELPARGPVQRPKDPEEEGGEENAEMEAGDMFSSSPVRNDDYE